MKKIFFLTIFAIIALSFGSCTRQEKEVQYLAEATILGTGEVVMLNDPDLEFIQQGSTLVVEYNPFVQFQTEKLLNRTATEWVMFKEYSKLSDQEKSYLLHQRVVSSRKIPNSYHLAKIDSIYKYVE